MSSYYELTVIVRLVQFPQQFQFCRNRFRGRGRKAIALSHFSGVWRAVSAGLRQP